MKGQESKMSEEYKLGKLLKDNGLWLSAAESLTGGGFGYTITSHPGASEYFKGTLVTYVNDIKRKLGVKEETLKQYGAVSSECALEMAMNAKNFFGTDVAVSFTGNAGPSALEGKPVGLVYIGIIVKNQPFVYSNIFLGERNEVRKKCIEFGIETLEEIISTLYPEKSE